MGISLFKDMIEHDQVFEFFMNYLADAERTVELTQDISLKEFFGPKHEQAFDQHRKEEFGHAQMIDQLLIEDGFKLFAMADEFQVIAKYKRQLAQDMFAGDNTSAPKNLTPEQLATWAAYFYCAEKCAFESFRNLKKKWEHSNNKRSKKAASVIERILVDERNHMKFAWSLTLEHTSSVAEARKLVKTTERSYKKLLYKTESILISKLKEIIVASETTKLSQKLAWRTAAGLLQLRASI